MTDTIEAAPALGVGGGIYSYGQIDSLPVGAVLTYRDSGHKYTKFEDGWEPSTSPGARWNATMFDLDGANILESLPSHPVAVGAKIESVEQLRALPLGSVIRGRSRYHKVTDETFRTSAGRGRAVDAIRLDGYFIIESVAAEPVAAPNDTAEYAKQETLARYKQRFRTTVFGAQQNAGVSDAVVHRAMDSLGVPDPDPCPGMVVSHADAALIERLPTGTVLVLGKDTSAYAAYAVYGKNGGYLERLLGGATEDQSHIMRIVSVPGVEAAEWVTAESSESEQELIMRFKRRAWQIGAEAKAENSWCGEYERAMALAGITQDDLARDRGAGGVSPEAAARTPEGTIFRFTDPAEGTVLYRRDDSAANPAKTVRIGGSLPGEWASGQSMVQVWHQGEVMRIPVTSYTEMDGMPIGTVMSDTTGNRWTKREHLEERPRQCWFAGRENYAYTSTQFSLGNLYYTEIP